MDCPPGRSAANSEDLRFCSFQDDDLFHGEILSGGNLLRQQQRSHVARDLAVFVGGHDADFA